MFDDEDEISKRMIRDKQIDLDVLHDFKNNASCIEVTQLYRSANQLIKTLYVARTAMNAGQDNRAILNYSEVAYLFIDKLVEDKQHQNVGICYNNIACIKSKGMDSEKQNKYFEKAIKNAEFSNIKYITFKRACRYYNYGYAVFKQYL